ncbi:MAG: oligosaccharide flippase family protein [Bacteroidales bacterium]
MQKKFLSNLILILFLNLLVKPFYQLGIDRGVINAVGPSEYGIYFTIFNLTLVFNVLLDMGINNFNNRNIAQNAQLLAKHFSGIFVLRFLLGIIYLFVLTLVILSGKLQIKTEMLNLVLLMGVNQFLISLILYLRSNISGLLLFKYDSFISVLDRLILIGIVGYLLWFANMRQHFKIEWYVFAQTAAYLITALVAITIVLKNSGKIKFYFNLPFYLVIIKKSLPLATLILLMTFYTRADTLLINMILPSGEAEYQAGIYGASNKLAEAGNNILFLFSALLLPLFSKMIKEKLPVDEIIKLSTSIIFSGTIIIAFASYFFRIEIMELLYNYKPNIETISEYHSKIAEMASSFPIFMISFIAIGGGYIFGTLLTANGSFKTLNYIAIPALLVSLILNLVLIPKYKVFGSAIANACAQYTILGLQLIITKKQFKFKIKRSTYFRFIGFLVGIIIFGKIAVNLNYNWKLEISALLILSILLANVLRLFSIKNFITILKMEQ